ncbi:MULTISPECIES: MCE family protein [unclassified Mycobacterium]|uniref:MCE family protein n=1 Tax=unclassified Mycobacterium TaxID=2642494 RepID=UPI0029C7DD9B|nr:MULTISPECIES: MCE family protein [unclassified Mycobacterium]
MKAFAERNTVIVGVVGVALTAVAVLVALNYRHLPFVTGQKQYAAFFSEAGGIAPGSSVQVSGYEVGKVSNVSLDGPRVLVTFKVDGSVHLGDRTEAAIKTKSLLGTRTLEVVSRGDGDLSGPIPVDRTTPPYQLTDALGDLATTVDQLDTGQLSQSLDTLAQTFANTPPDLQAAVHGLSRFSESLNIRDAQLRNLLSNANKATKVLAERSDQVVALITHTNALLAELRTESDALDQVSGNLSQLSRQASAFVADNRQQLKPSVDKLNGVLTIVANRRERLQDAIKRLSDYAMSLGESVSSGPFFNAYIANLLPGQFLQPFIDAAFSDLGLNPDVKLPSELTDPQTGQLATPALPIPYPRTGQGGEPNLTLPDAITGNPGDPRYPYREPLPAPPPGGPPPGPPLPGAEHVEPTPSPTYQPAPNEVPPRQETP